MIDDTIVSGRPALVAEPSANHTCIGVYRPAIRHVTMAEDAVRPRIILEFGPQL
jgi:hypothetical protein